MPNISKITLPNNTTYDIRDAKKSGVYTVFGTQVAATASWTGVLHGVTELFDGLMINYFLPYAGISSTQVTLELTLDNGTTTGVKNVYLAANTRLTTHYGAGRTIVMTYYSAGSISIAGTTTTDDRWLCDAYYDADTKARQTLLSTNTNRPLLMSYGQTNNTTGNVDNITYRNNSIYANPSKGSITATKFIGTLDGDASTVGGHTVATNVPDNAAFTDQYVNQAANADANVAYQLLFEDTANSGNIKSGTRKSSNLSYNPSTSTLTLGDTTPAGGTISVSNLSATKLNGSTIPTTPKLSDQAVQQLEGGGNADYEIILEDTASSGEITAGTRKSSNLTFNPSTGKLTVSGQVDCSGMSVSTPTYTMTKTSGAWNVGSVTARKSGNIIQMQVFVKGTGTSVTNGGSGFVGKITGTYLPSIPTTFVSYISSVIIVCYIDTSGNIDVRPYGNTYTASSGTNIEIDGMFICS